MYGRVMLDALPSARRSSGAACCLASDDVTELGLQGTWVMPLTKEVQVAYLLQRLDPAVCAFVGFRLPAEVALVSATEVAARQCLEKDRGKPVPATPLFKCTVPRT